MTCPLLDKGEYEGFYGAYLNALQNEAFRDAMICLYVDNLGSTLAGLMIYGAVSLYLYIRTGSVIVPFVLVVLVGAAVLPTLPANAIAAAVVVLLFVVGMGPVALVRRMDVV